MCLCVYVFVCVLLLFFSHRRIHLFSSLAASLFNKLIRYSLLDDLVKFAVQEPTADFTLIGASCRPRRARNVGVN